jgi:hypothetical protein
MSNSDPGFSPEFKTRAIQELKMGLTALEKTTAPADTEAAYQNLRCQFPPLLYQVTGHREDTDKETYIEHIQSVLEKLAKGFNRNDLRRTFPRKDGAFIPCQNHENSIVITANAGSNLARFRPLVLKFLGFEADLQLILEEKSHQKEHVYANYIDTYYHPVLSDLVSDVLIYHYLDKTQNILDQALLYPRQGNYLRKDMASAKDLQVFTDSLRTQLAYSFHNHPSSVTTKEVSERWLKILRKVQAQRDDRSFDGIRKLTFAIFDSACRELSWLNTYSACAP